MVLCGVFNRYMLLNAPRLSFVAAILSFSGMVNATAEANSPLVEITVYSCVDGNLVQSPHKTDESVSASLIRSGQAVFSNGMVDASTIDAIAEGRGIWSAAPLITLAQVAGSQIPPDILTAIAVKESGMKGRFWPWTINWNGKSLYLESREKAIETAKHLVKKGYSNFDVAVMQVNWRWHGHRFESIEAAFDPVKNIQVAGQILAEHYKATGNWRSTIARYHSRTQSLNQPYLAGVLEHLGRIQKSSPKTPEKHLC